MKSLALIVVVAALCGHIYAADVKVSIAHLAHLTQGYAYCVF